MSYKSIALSGKCYSGKSYAAKFLSDRFNHLFNGRFALGDLAKMQYAREAGVKQGDLYSFRKENHRLDLIAWCDDLITKEPGYFIDEYMHRLDIKAPHAILEDVRRLAELQPILDSDRYLIIRIEAELEVRTKNGYKPVPARDEHPSETELDRFPWHEAPNCLVICNHGDKTFGDLLTAAVYRYILPGGYHIYGRGSYVQSRSNTTHPA